MKKNRKRVVQVVVDEDFKRAIEHEARRRRTTVSNLIRSQLIFCLPENIGKQIKNNINL